MSLGDLASWLGPPAFADVSWGEFEVGKGRREEGSYVMVQMEEVSHLLCGSLRPSKSAGLWHSEPSAPSGNYLF